MLLGENHKHWVQHCYTNRLLHNYYTIVIQIDRYIDRYWNIDIGRFDQLAGCRCGCEELSSLSFLIIITLIPVCDLTMLSVLRPTGPAGRIPLGPCSNTAPSDFLVDHSQPPKRLVDSNTMTWRTKHDHFWNRCCQCEQHLKLIILPWSKLT